MCNHFDQTCPMNTSVCLTENGIGCCKFSNAVCCPNMNTCCPEGFICSGNGCQKEETNDFVPMFELNKWTLSDLRKLNWEGILKCLLNFSSLGPDVVKLIKAIKEKKYIECADIAFSLLGQGCKVVQKCIEYMKKNEHNQIENKMKFGFDWEALIRCIQSTSPLVEDIIALADAIKVKDYSRAISIVYKLIEKGNQVVKECIKNVILHQNSFTFNWEEFEKCLQSAAPLVKEIKELIDAIKAKDYSHAVQLAYKLIESGSEIAKQCMKAVIVQQKKQKNKLKFDWNAFLKCLMSTAPIAEEIIKLVEAIQQGDYAKALELIYKLLVSGSEVVKECMKVVYKNKKFIKENYLEDNFLKFDWDAFLKCLMSTAPMAQEIIKLIEVIKKGDYVTAIQLVYKLIAQGSEVVKECMKGTQNKNSFELEDVFLNGFDWDAFLKCIMSTAPMVQEIINLIEVIKAGDYVKAIKLTYELIASGSEIVKKCMEVMLHKNGIEPNGWIEKVSKGVKDVKKYYDIAKPWIQKGKEIYDIVSNEEEANGWLQTIVKGVAKHSKDIKKAIEIGQKGKEIYDIVSNEEESNGLIKKISKKVEKHAKDAKKYYDIAKPWIQKGKEIYDIVSNEEEMKMKELVDNKISINDILKIVACLQSTGPKVGPITLKIKDLINAAKTFNIFEAIRLIGELEKDKSGIIESCKNNENGIKELVKSINWKAVYNCIIDSKPTVEGMYKLYTLIKSKDHEEAYNYAYSLIKGGHKFVKECIEQYQQKNEENRIKIKFNIDWESVLECIKSSEPITQDVLELIRLIKAKKYREAFAKGYEIIKEGNDIVKKCFNKSTANDIAVNINWKALLKCLVEHLPDFTKDIDVVKELIEAIKAKNFAKALELVYQLFQDGQDIFKICIAPTKNQENKLSLPKFKINWDLLITCIKEAGPIAQDVIALVKAIKVESFVQAGILLNKILKPGNLIIKKCMNIAQKKVYLV